MSQQQVAIDPGSSAMQQTTQFSSSPYAGSPIQYPHQQQQLQLQIQQQRLQLQQQQQQQQQQIQLQQQQQARMGTPMQQRSSQPPEQQTSLGAGPQTAQGIPAAHLPPGYLQSQIMRQRQAAAAANWAMQQERNNMAMRLNSTQRLGSAILRLLNFSEQLNSFSQSSSLQAWRTFVDEFYIDPALCTHALPVDPSLSFELPTPLLPAYFYQLHRELSKFALTFHDAKEYYMPPANHVVECPKATLCYYFPNATKVEMLGRLRVVFAPGPQPNMILKIENWEFIGESWDEWVCRQPPPPNKPQNSSDPTYDDNLMGEDKQIDKEKARVAQKEQESEEDDHEDLFGRSPSGSGHVSSRPPSRANIDKEENRANKNMPTKDLNKRKRMVLDRGITARHMRMLEVSDVLGQLSPLFGRGNPRVKLDNLLRSLPDLPRETAAADNESPAVQPSIGSSKTLPASQTSTQGSVLTQREQGRQAQATRPDQQISSGRSMQQEAAKVLQKQAAQTLSQALPPTDLDFELGGDVVGDDDHDLENSNDSMREHEMVTNRNGKQIKQEEVDGEHDPLADLGLDLGENAQADRSSEFNVEGAFMTSHKSTVTGSKREGEAAGGPGKKQKKSDGFDQD